MTGNPGRHAAILLRQVQSRLEGERRTVLHGTVKGVGAEPSDAGGRNVRPTILMTRRLRFVLTRERGAPTPLESGSVHPISVLSATLC